MIKILTVNIGAAAAERAKRQLAWLLRQPADVFVLTETSSGPGTRLILDKFCQLGYEVVHTADPAGDRGVAVVSKIGLHREPAPDLSGISIPGRAALVRLDTTPAVYVLGVYVPSRDQSYDKTLKKRLFIESLLRWIGQLPPEIRRALVVGGDYNVIDAAHQPQYPFFLGFEKGLSAALEQLGLTDVHHQVYPDQQIYTWVGRTGDGYRYDYFHVGEALATLVRELVYVHGTRQGETAFTDHSALEVKLDAAASRYTDPSQEQGELF